MNINRGLWSEEEHDRFLDAIQIYPHGPWIFVAKRVGTRNIRQVQTHAQKYYEKISRHLRGLRKDRVRILRQEHRIDVLPVGLRRPIVIEQLEGKGVDTLGVQDVKTKTCDSASSESEDDTQFPPDRMTLEESLDYLLQWLEDEC